MADLFDLTGKVALVTGGSRGLGRAMVLAFAEHGADVVITSRKAANCELVAEEARAFGVRALPYGCHVGHWDELDGLADTAYAEFGKVDILVNNAGMSPLYPKLSAVTEDLFDKVVGVNLKGPYRLSAIVGERMAAGDGGAIVNVSSTAAVQATPRIRAVWCRQGGHQFVDVVAGPRLRPQGARQLHPGWAVPHRHFEGLGHGSLREERQDRHRPAAWRTAGGSGGGGAIPRQRGRQFHDRRNYPGRRRITPLAGTAGPAHRRRWVSGRYP